ncbi:hypothetical protein [Haloarchaeobius iranensis]|uniref:PRC-barrel domain-containing protein n=1 Tax=Haloarchaeobius iranensis TaxID=996166 RepID=A0A1H0B5R2_9EURY|nr:hypothetical protein [Haloarchaeobius iranensis]SDN40964.1 hypothetical protein SAMN05192554_1345 [Haloarchaeobius iranensis]
MAQSQLSESDEGKRVVDRDGNKVGIVSGFSGGIAHVNPDPSIADTILAKLGWENVDEDDYALAQSDVETVTEDEIRLKI